MSIVFAQRNSNINEPDGDNSDQSTTTIWLPCDILKDLQYTWKMIKFHLLRLD